MYFCESCRQKRSWPESLYRSLGRCEVCGISQPCHSVAARNLPENKKEETDMSDGYYKITIVLEQITPDGVTSNAGRTYDKAEDLIRTTLTGSALPDVVRKAKAVLDVTAL